MPFGVVGALGGLVMSDRSLSLQISAYPTSVAALAFSRDGRTLAVASSYTYEQGEQAHAPDAIYLRPMSDAETRPKKPRAAI